MTILKRIFSMYGWFKGDAAPDRGEVSAVFRAKYSAFKALLESNSELARIVTEMEEMSHGERVFGVALLRSQTSRIIFHAMRMITSFEALSGLASPELQSRLEEIGREIKEALDQRRETGGSLTLDYPQVDRDSADLVGGKSANLGEVANHVGLPVPDGFAITTEAFRLYMEEDGLGEEIAKAMLAVHPEEQDTIKNASETIQRLILLAPLPEALAASILSAQEGLARRLGVPEAGLKLAMRSSAIGEDSEFSFAGQYVSVLGVSREEMLKTYSLIVASLYTPRAIAYRLRKGIPDLDLAMSVACLCMVDARSSGVMYSRDPIGRGLQVTINALWGLGPYVVDGVLTPDRFVVSRQEPREIVESVVARKPVQLRLAESGTREEPVPPEEQDAPSLTREQVQELAAMALLLEEHYGEPQDVEWALENGSGRLVVLQSRPLGIALGRPDASAARPASDGRTALLTGGEMAMAGAGAGPVVLYHKEEDLRNFPEGGVLVASQTSPKFVIVMDKASAIVTDFGGATGHMASLSREFGIPTLVGAKVATASLKPGEMVTVDATACRVLAGRDEEILTERSLGRQGPSVPLLRNTPIHRLLMRLSGLILPLTLVDPRAPTFTAGSCKTVHDIMRFIHEKSYGEMFRLGDIASNKESWTVRFQSGTALDLHIIDLGGGIAERTAKPGVVTLEEISSPPLCALLDGLLALQGIRREPRPVQLGGFLSVMREQMLTNPVAGGERFGDKSYTLVSDKYLNFSSRVGYHYGIVDSYCGNTPSNNYITFSFKGGAADDVRRQRRARCIALILERSGFVVDVQGDRAEGRFKKAERDSMLERLRMLGRLLQYTRQMDMLMADEGSVTVLADKFLAGDYKLREFGVEA